MTNERIIWKNFKNGEKSALSFIYYQHVDALFNFGMKISSNPDLVKDAMQELFYDLIRQKKTLGEVKNIRFYLLKSLRRRILKSLAKSRKSVDIEDNPEVIPFDVDYSIEEELIKNEDKSVRERKLLSALQKLSPRQKEAIYLRFNCEMEYDEICEIMDLNYDSARKLVHRSLKSLREVMGEPTRKSILLLIA
ncbi:sigma-70 family RNA polymerase sigma factor [Puteibacter caeruleilacunae]|nr:sigma-70 family RNA polymerase sigma factor [Puteibacter caeruleilacunae]